MQPIGAMTAGQQWATPTTMSSSSGARTGDESHDLDTTLSSTTPDVRRGATLLPLAESLAWGAGIGSAIGALLLRGRGAGWSLGALGAGALKGAAIGAGLGAALVGVDRLTGGQVQQKLDYLSLDRRAQIWFVLSNPTRPWIASTGLDVARDARAAQVELYGSAEPLDGPQDAFRHAYAAALFSLRAMRDHSEAPATAQRLAVAAGAAHEVDGQDNNDRFSRAMDHLNNDAGALIAGDGRARDGEAADASGWVTEQALRQRVLNAMAAGSLQLVDRAGSDAPITRPSTPGDLPAGR
jgi:hypothetical protein